LALKLQGQAINSIPVVSVHVIEGASKRSTQLVAKKLVEDGSSARVQDAERGGVANWVSNMN
jgi:hypothetical protein